MIVFASKKIMCQSKGRFQGGVHCSNPDISATVPLTFIYYFVVVDMYYQCKSFYTVKSQPIKNHCW